MSAKRRLRSFFARPSVKVLVALVLLAALWRVARKPLFLPKPPRPDAATYEQAKRVRIVRDTWGVPHVFGKSDADAAFGLAYAHAEDDFSIVQAVLAAATGRLSLLLLSKEALANDYYVGLVRVREQVEEQYASLAPDYRASRRSPRTSASRATSRTAPSAPSCSSGGTTRSRARTSCASSGTAAMPPTPRS